MGLRPLSSHSSGTWLVLVVLLVGVLVPAGCILWFMNAAMTSERLAVRQRLLDVYQGFLGEAQSRINDYWVERLHELDDVADLPPAEAFGRTALAGTADAAIIFDDSGRPAYPQLAPVPAPPAARPPQWAEAQWLEDQGDAFREAAAAYAAIARDSKDVIVRSQALRAEARCLLRGGQKELAIEALRRLAAAADLGPATDDEGRLIVPAAQLLLLELTGDPEGPAAAPLLGGLTKRVNDYSSPMPSGQRLFLMEQLLPYCGAGTFPTLPAERLASGCAETIDLRPAQRGAMYPLAAGDVWLLVSRNGRTGALYRDETLLRILTPLVGSPPHGAAVVIETDGSASRPRQPFLRANAGRFLPTVQLALHLEGSDPFAAAAARQNAIYLGTAGAGIVLVALLALAVAGYLRRQMRLTRLKNDFVATVTHELKTPLASMRLLVDTVLEGRARDSQQVRDYLRLIARENERLTRLIDNFLTFSRMERNKRSFEFGRVEVAEIVEAACAAEGERFNRPGCRLESEVPTGLPTVYGDRDALVTVLMNLLDNAWKYSGEEKVVRLRAWAEAGAVCVEVADNGIGMTRRAQRRIFGRFYQVDSSLSRRAGGCGLGLAIVKFILDAHGATIDVSSQPGRGSTFTVRLPADESARVVPAEQEPNHAE